ncbi:MAG: DUF4102 domain-containing protein, partial [Rhodospirillaceae bacterium]|nr:DUF4102 domain-containing protein [Rhodospirillaceae bacterium]
ILVRRLRHHGRLHLGLEYIITPFNMPASESCNALNNRNSCRFRAPASGGLSPENGRFCLPPVCRAGRVRRFRKGPDGMAKRVSRLTDRTARALPANSGDAVYWDGDLTGFGVRVRASGRKTWVFQTRVRGRLRWFTLGPCGALGAGKIGCRGHERRRGAGAGAGARGAGEAGCHGCD